jgi:Rrf2 family protein
MPLLGKGVEYAIHSMYYLVDASKDSTMTIADLATFQNISESYLAKIFTRLQKGGLVRSNLGVKGGYVLAKSPEDISFWDIAVAVEGRVSLFECHDVRSGCVIGLGNANKTEVCTVHAVFLEASQKLEAFLKTRNLRWLHTTLLDVIPDNMRTEAENWFNLQKLRK